MWNASKRIVALCAIVAATTLGTLPAAAQAPVGTAFSYQGQLTDQGAAVDGSADFIVTLWDADAGGSSLGTVSVQNTGVADGIFTLELDFGAGAFDGDEKWLEIDVRAPHDPTDTDPYTTLTPRQEVLASPHALVSQSPWEINGNAVTNTDSRFVGINRTNQLTSNEVFGIRADTGFSYGGMYMETAGSSSLPFYGYAHEGLTASVWHYWDKDTGKWHLRNDGNRLTVQNDGNVGIGTDFPASRLEVAGQIHSTTDGFKFPDGTVQTSAAAAGASLWQDVGGDIMNSNTGFVGINRTAQVSTAEEFGIRSDNSEFGGMYIQSASATGLPFYGYDVVGGERMWHEFEGSTSKWKLYNSGYRMTVQSDGNVGIGTTAPDEKLHVAGDVRIDGALGSVDGTDFEIGTYNGGTFSEVGNFANTTFGNRLQMEGTTGRNTWLGSTGSGADADRGALYIYDDDGSPAVFRWTAAGSELSADVKNFREPNPRDPNTDIWYACVEGPEAGAYDRGTAQLVNGHATVTFAEHFQDVIEEAGMTIQLTPRSADALGLAVVSESGTGFEVREIQNGTGTYEFYWEVKAVRRGYADYQVIRPTSYVESSTDVGR